MPKDKDSRSSRRIALYPGAFRPPHEAHLTALQALVARPDVDEVIVIISRRCRILPGSTKALDAEIARKIWAIYLKKLPEGASKVRLEVAEHTAVAQALSYFKRVNPGDALLFCIGAADLEKGDDRFSCLPELARQSGASAELIAAATGKITVRSTDLRNILARGPDGREGFLAALPPLLDAEAREHIWMICREGVRDLSEIVEEKLSVVLARSALGQPISLRPVRRNKLDPVFRAELKDGRICFVKYAGDTVSAGRWGSPLHPKPRRRLGAERRFGRAYCRRHRQNYRTFD